MKVGEGISWCGDEKHFYFRIFVKYILGALQVTLTNKSSVLLLKSCKTCEIETVLILITDFSLRLVTANIYYDRYLERLHRMRYLNYDFIQ